MNQPERFQEKQPNQPARSQSDKRDKGVTCPECSCRHIPAIGGTHEHFDGWTRKKRRCRNCGKIFRTIEQVVE